MSQDPYAIGAKVEKPGLSISRIVSGVTRISPKVRLFLAIGGGVLLLLLLYAVESIDSKPKPIKVDEESGEEKKAASSANMPKDFLDVGDGTPGAIGPAPVFGPDGKPLQDSGLPTKVPPLGGSAAPAATPDLDAAPHNGSSQTLEEKKRLAYERAVEADGKVSGFTPDSTFGRDNPATPSPASLGAVAPGAQNEMPMPAGGQQGQEQDDPNKQIRKEKFIQLAQQEEDDGYLTSLRRSQISRYELKAGSVIPSAFKSGVNSDLPGQIRGIVSEDVYDTRTGKYKLIPKGTTLVGTYDSQIAFGQQRILAVWSKLIYPDGTTMALKGMPASDEEGYAGLSAHVDNHWMRIFGGAIATSIISAGYQLSQNGTSLTDGTAATPGQTIASSLGQQLGQAGTSMINKNMAIQPTLSNQVAKRFYVNVTKDMVFEHPYAEQ